MEFRITQDTLYSRDGNRQANLLGPVPASRCSADGGGFLGCLIFCHLCWKLYSKNWKKKKKLSHKDGEQQSQRTNKTGPDHSAEIKPKCREEEDFGGVGRESTQQDPIKTSPLFPKLCSFCAGWEGALYLPRWTHHLRRQFWVSFL